LSRIPEQQVTGLAEFSLEHCVSCGFVQMPWMPCTQGIMDARLFFVLFLDGFYIPLHSHVPYRGREEAATQRADGSRK
jgi:hypothetical protein